MTSVDRERDTLIGAKCHLCAHLLGSSHQVEPRTWLPRPSRYARWCDNCSYCQRDLIETLMQTSGWSMFSPEARQAVQDLFDGRPNPIIDSLRAEILAISGGDRTDLGGDG